MTRRLLSFVLGLLLLCAAGPVAAQTVILVRHAEKADASSDPVLSEAGQARAEALAQALQGLPLTNILVTPLKRTTLTAAPTAAAHGLSAQAISLEGGAEAHVARLVDQIRTLPPEAVVLVVGHSNTIPAIARALGYAIARDMNDCEYNRLMAIDLQTGESAVAVFGAASPCP